jgi:hypothetical protein
LAYAFGTAIATERAEVFRNDMNTTIKNIIKSFALVAMMGFGLVLVSSTSVSAQDRDDQYGNRTYQNDRNNDDRYNSRNRVNQQALRKANQRGYQEGLKQGRTDARNRNQNRGYGNNGAYGNNGGYGNYGGYQNGRGNNAALSQAYQQGFQRGYQEALNRYGNNNRSRIWPF